MNFLTPCYMSGIVIGTRRDRPCQYLTGEKFKEESDFLNAIQIRAVPGFPDFWS